MRILILVIILLVPSYLLSEWEWEMLMEDVYGITVYEGVIYIGTDDGIKKSSDNGDTWENFALNNHFIYHIEFVNNNIYALGRDSKDSVENIFYFSNDFGISWNYYSMPKPTDIVFKNNKIYIVDGDNNTCYISSNNGETWKKIEMIGIVNQYNSIMSIEVDNSENIYVGTDGKLEYKNEIFVSSNGGETWQLRVNGISLFDRETYIRQIYTHSDSIFAIMYGGVYLSTNEGYFWYLVSDIGAIKFLIYKNLMFVGNDFALYYSLFGSDKMLNTGLKEYIHKIKVNEATNTIFVLGNHYIPGKGYSPVSLYRASLEHVTSVQDQVIKTDEYEINLYPNPASNVLNFNFVSEMNYDVSVSIYDILGKKVIELPQSKYGYGINFERIDISGLTNGTYTFVINVNGFSHSKLFTVIRNKGGLR